MNVEEVTPEPTPVKISFDSCPIHNFRFVSMPRDKDGDDLGFVAKCGLRGCFHGIRKNTPEEK